MVRVRQNNIRNGRIGCKGKISEMYMRIMTYDRMERILNIPYCRKVSSVIFLIVTNGIYRRICVSLDLRKENATCRKKQQPGEPAPRKNTNTIGLT
jgi:hypothetical protein